MDDHERSCINRIRAGDEAAFRSVFETYYPALCRFAGQYVRIPSHAKDIVQQVFLHIWESRADWQVHTSLKAYLYQAVRNRALNNRRRDTAASDMQDRLQRTTPSATDRTAEDTFAEDRLRQRIHDAIEALPTRQRTAFLLKRRHGLTYREIAVAMDIAPKTVENHMGRALQSLRQKLSTYVVQHLDA